MTFRVTKKKKSLNRFGPHLLQSLKRDAAADEVKQLVFLSYRTILYGRCLQIQASRGQYPACFTSVP